MMINVHFKQMAESMGYIELLEELIYLAEVSLHTLNK